ncbi:MAG: nucleotide exchange factor GrpE [Actinobacteria bacterium]|nr:nucleotide exchange factor GrpE [Actinomycetota bacterium]
MNPRRDADSVDPARGSSEHRSGGAPAERARSGREIGPIPVTDPELLDDLGAEYEFRGDQLEEQLEGARRDAAAHLDTAQRLQADFDNYRKRVARDAEDSAKRAGQRVILEMLPALDNLERALAHVEGGGEGAQLTDGVRMVLQQVLDVFAKEGAERIDPLGQAFDPNEHQAVGRVERPDVPEGTVVDMYQPGYRMHGRVLRPASVVVSTGGPAPKE